MGLQQAVPKALPLVLPVTMISVGEKAHYNLTDWLEVTREDGRYRRNQHYATMGWFKLVLTSAILTRTILRNWLRGPPQTMAADIYVGRCRACCTSLALCLFLAQFSPRCCLTHETIPKLLTKRDDLGTSYP